MEIRKLYPKASFYGEELGELAGSDEQLFVLDPIDGTANFIFGIPHFAVSIAEVIAGEVVRAIVYNPMTNDLFYADVFSRALLNGLEKAGGVCRNYHDQEYDARKVGIIVTNGLLREFV